MKKNLMSVIILALVVVNLVLTAILMFTILPQTQQANKMIEKVCQAIDLELNSGAATGLSNLPVEQLVTYNIGEGTDMTINLSDGKYAVLSVSLVLNKESKTYAESTTTVLSDKEPIIKDCINGIIRQYTKEELRTNTDDIKAEILKELQKMFTADYIVGISFSKLTMD